MKYFLAVIRHTIFGSCAHEPPITCYRAHLMQAQDREEAGEECWKNLADHGSGDEVVNVIDMSTLCPGSPSLREMLLREIRPDGEDPLTKLVVELYSRGFEEGAGGKESPGAFMRERVRRVRLRE